ncbi:carbohydrate ABC transporter permease [Acutalibacter sp.]|jgi:multiple sugar transport system permease protein|uniref:carbohydrate ABC transporter permease n=1 Tax=Acutalibacter sp. TaxID=1918636 RepID=UPI0021733859|nr:sugar ABC transporter permease [Acutalibacter sp.]
MRNKRSYWLFLLPSLLGVAFFYIVPFIYSFCYAVIDNMTSWEFVGLRHFEETLCNPLFLQAAGNTVLFVCICVPLSMGLALLLALCLKGLKRCRPLATLVLLVPLVVPSGSIVSFWNTLFSSNGLVMKMLLQAGFSHEAVSPSDWSMAALVVIFLWKNVSYNIVLFWSGLNWIPKTYYEQMALEGAGVFRQFANVTWVYLAPTTFVVLLMSIVNSFKVFKEVYMLYGSYPSPEIYMLQHYMNNQFAAMNMQKLSAAAYIMFLVIGLLLLAVFYAQKRVTDSFQ